MPRLSLKRREARLAWWMISPTLFIALSIVILPVLANFWIAFKNIRLSDLRTPRPAVRELVLSRPAAAGDLLAVRLIIFNRAEETLSNVQATATLAPGLKPRELPEDCGVQQETLTCRIGDLGPQKSERLRLNFTAGQAYFGHHQRTATLGVIDAKGYAPNPLFAKPFTILNFQRVFADPDFRPMLWTTLAYTVFGTGLSILLGLFAAQLLSVRFAGRNFLRALFLFPYIAPVIAVAFTWVFLLAPFAGTVNALLLKYGVIHGPVAFLSQRYFPVHFFGSVIRVPLALSMLILFEGWRYFPFAFLFILARLQAIPRDMYEAAKMDGAGIVQTFWYITLPQLRGILATLVLLRFIWTFNKFDDVFLLTGGAGGTQTITIKIYNYAFAASNIGQGAALAVVLFGILAAFLLLYFRFSPQEEV